MTEQGKPPADKGARKSPGETIAELDRLIGMGQAAMGDRSDQAHWLGWLRQAGMLFCDPVASADPARLGEVLARAREAAAFLECVGLRSDVHNALWLQYCALHRLRRPAEALYVLENISLRLEQDRAQITAPMRRAGVLAAFPQLAIAAAERAAELDDPRRMLAAIEAAKGRALADLLTLRDGRPADEGALRRDTHEAARLTRQLGVHYLSFLVVPDAAFAVLVTRAGEWHWAQLPADNACIAAMVERLQPKYWEAPPLGAPFDLGAALAPLVDWLVPLRDRGVLADGAHLVYSPDGLLQQVPLHMAHWPERPIGEQIMMSRVHGLDALRRIAGTAPGRPDRALGLFVPRRNEPQLADKHQAARRALAAAGLAGTWQPAETIDATFIASLSAPGALVYMNAHGSFPEENMEGLADPNPFSSAGLDIANAGALPEANSAWPGRVTPKLVVESAGLDLAGSAVILQGCVSGLAKEGTGGDALGLEWAVLTRGAATVLASHWNVNFRSAGAFSHHFLDAWLVRKTSRIEAWRHACTETARDPEGGARHDCAAFSLSGDWR